MLSLISWGTVGLGVVVSIVLGSLWFGPIFGKKWASLMGMDLNDKAKVAEAQKGMWKQYVLQMIFSAVTVAVLSIVVLNFDNFTTNEVVGTSLLMWLGFVLPLQVGAVLWSGKKKSLAISMLLIDAGYQFVLHVLLGLIIAQTMF